MSIDTDFRTAVSLASARLLARSGFVRAAFDIALDETHHRDRRTNAFAAALLALWRRYQAGELSRAQFETESDQLIRATSDAVVTTYADEYGVDAQQLRAGSSGFKLSRFMTRASLAAVGGLVLFSPSAESPSDAMATMRANQVAGPIFAAHWLVEATAQPDTTIATWGAVDDQNTCSPCAELDGQSWSIDEIPYFPGEGEPCEGEMLCRCELTFSGGNFERPLTLERSAY